MKKKLIGILVCMTLMLPALSVTAIANEPPTAPDIEGPPSGKPGVEYTYGFCSTDPDGDDIFYCIDWGDGSGEICIGPYSSGICATATHTWSEQGTYIIKAKAKDIYDAESELSTLDVTMPINIPFIFNFNLLSWLFERFPNAFPILRHVLGL